MVSCWARTQLAIATLVVAALASHVFAAPPGENPAGQGGRYPLSAVNAGDERNAGLGNDNNRREPPGAFRPQQSMAPLPPEGAAGSGPYAEPAANDAQRASASLPLARPGADGESATKIGEPSASRRAAPRGAADLLVTAFGSLSVVLGLFLCVMWLVRRSGRGGVAQLPREAFQVLGRGSLAPQQSVQLVRYGPKLLLVALSSKGAETLSEITEPAEVARLSELCEQSAGSNPVASFGQILQQFTRRGATRERGIEERGPRDAAEDFATVPFEDDADA